MGISTNIITSTMKLNSYIIFTTSFLFCNISPISTNPLQKSSTTFRIKRPASYYRTIQKHKLNPRDFLRMPAQIDANDIGYSRRRRNQFIHIQKTPVMSKISRKEQYLRRRREYGKRQLSCRRTCGSVCEKRNPFGKCKLPNLKQTLNFSLCEGICMLCQNNKIKDLNINTCSSFVPIF